MIDIGGIDIDGSRKNRLGGTALATVFSQIGDDAADIDDVSLLKNMFCVMQQLISERLIISGHDRSDGGLIVTLLEMAFAGNCGLEITLPAAGGKTGM